MKEAQAEEMKQYLKDNVSGILQKMTLDILYEKPDDVILFMKKWIDEKGY